MKKLSILMVVFLFCISSEVFAQSSASPAVITEMVGTVELKRPNQDNWISARAGDQLTVNTIISTGMRSTAILQIGNSTLLVRAVTRLSISELVRQNEAETVNVNLGSGRVRVEVNPPAGGRTIFGVQSPSTVASVRGTSFNLDTVSIQVLEGEVVYAPQSGSARAVTVRAGEESWIESGGILHPMRAAAIRRALPKLPGENEWANDGRVRRSGFAEVTITNYQQ